MPRDTLAPGGIPLRKTGPAVPIKSALMSGLVSMTLPLVSKLLKSGATRLLGRLTATLTAALTTFMLSNNITSEKLSEMGFDGDAQQMITGVIGAITVGVIFLIDWITTTISMKVNPPPKAISVTDISDDPSVDGRLELQAVTERPLPTQAETVL